MRLIYILSFLLFVSCDLNNNADYNIIQREEFKNILMDVLLQDSVWDILNTDTVLSQHLIKKYKITQYDFDATLDYYFDNLEELDILYQEIIDSLIVLEIN